MRARTGEGGVAAAAEVVVVEDDECGPVTAVEDEEDGPINAIVAVPSEVAQQRPQPPLKEAGRLRSVHYVYELPDDSPLLRSLPRRLPDDPCPFLLAVWGPGEAPPTHPAVDPQGEDLRREAPAAAEGPSLRGPKDAPPLAARDYSQSVPGTLLIPCRTAMRGSFPLNGTYFQVNEVFADHTTSSNPLHVPREHLWNLRRRFVLFGTSVPSVFRGLSAEEIRAIFWKGYICIRGFDPESRYPKPLAKRLHCATAVARSRKRPS